MRIAVQSADLDAGRIDGTRVYLLRLLERFGAMAPEHTWFLLHRSTFNPALTPPSFANYEVRSFAFPFFWTQTRFAFELFRLRPDRVFLPIQTMPFFLPKGTESVVTIHDLAFKIFPEHFPPRDLQRLNWFTDFAVARADRLIAVSESTKRDILKFYPSIREEKIRVIHHGFDALSEECDASASRELLKKHALVPKSYVLAVGAIQPRKNLGALISACEIVGKKFPDMKLVLAGEPAWMSEDIFRKIASSSMRDRIIVTGRMSFVDRAILYRNAGVFVFPSLYEGFGIPLLEAFSAGVPVIASDNSSLPEVAGGAAELFDATDVDALVDRLMTLWHDEEKKSLLIARGKKRIENFSWDTCARETLEWICR